MKAYEAEVTKAQVMGGSPKPGFLILVGVVEQGNDCMNFKLDFNGMEFELDHYFRDTFEELREVIAKGLDTPASMVNLREDLLERKMRDGWTQHFLTGGGIQ